MDKRTQQVIDNFRNTEKPAQFKNKITEVRYIEEDNEKLTVKIVRGNGKEQKFRIPIHVLEAAVSECLSERRLLRVSELHKLEGVGSWQESPVWAVLRIMPDSFWIE